MLAVDFSLLLTVGVTWVAGKNRGTAGAKQGPWQQGRVSEPNLAKQGAVGSCIRSARAFQAAKERATVGGWVEQEGNKGRASLFQGGVGNKQWIRCLQRCDMLEAIFCVYVGGQGS